MDSQAFAATMNSFFLAITENYKAETDLHADCDVFLAMLNSMFWDPTTLEQLSETTSIYEQIQEALKLVFWHNSQQADLDIAAVQKVLPEWPYIFSKIFNKEVRFLLPIYSPQFDIWENTGPAMTVNRFLELLKKHVDAYKHIHDIENAVLVTRQNKIIPKANGNINAHFTRGTKNDPNSHHRCMFCTRLDTNDRDDASVDHMQRVHNYYGDIEYRLRRGREVIHQKRKDANVLKSLISKERALYNSLAVRLHEATKAVARLRGIRYLTIPRLRDVQGQDLGRQLHITLQELSRANVPDG
ncbi:hypothetical protein VSDG_04807 [Cytospora chrysosperma]|uniref:Uncharacterized protein n=1 Tax=Cytospora chrysosperma TaxID=252740 RepID=A0A423W1N4_CYTCH|nr:hypothetical protein VSDG_04807 [Valsa sordida]